MSGDLWSDLDSLVYEWRNAGVTVLGRYPRGIAEAEDMCAAQLEAVLIRWKVES